MKKQLVTLVSLIFLTSLNAQELKKVFGKVSDGKAPMENVNVSIVGTEKATATDADGKYEIEVAVGDKLQYSYTGMKTITIRVEDVTRVLNPIMIADITELEEVVVKGSRRRSQKDLEEDFPFNKRIIRTAFGYIDADRAAGRVRFLTDDEITPVNFCILDLLRSKFAGVWVNGNCMSGGTVFIGGANSISNPRGAIFDVDGQIFTDAPIWLNISNFKRIAILNNFALTATYGNVGVGGVVVINTVTGNPRLGGIIDHARLRNNYFTEKLLSKSQVAANQPNYLKDLQASPSFEKAKEVFNRYDAGYNSSPFFYLDAYNYFSGKWNEQDFADAIIEENYALFENNAVLLKALAYSYQEQQRFDKANTVFKEIFILRPNYAQSYMDMANSYRDLNEVRQAASLYARYDYLLQEGFMEADTVGFGPIMEREFNNLLMLNKNAVVDGRKANKLFVAKETFEGTRLVFEWNDGEAEFELQFVNPENQYTKWKHSLADNQDEISREKDFGYNVKEYLIDDALPGTWKVNINYLGNKSLTPTYIKASVYYNYGSRAQRKETKLFKVTLKNINQELFKVQASGSLATK